MLCVLSHKYRTLSGTLFCLYVLDYRKDRVSLTLDVEVMSKAKCLAKSMGISPSRQDWNPFCSSIIRFVANKIARCDIKILNFKGETLINYKAENAMTKPCTLHVSEKRFTYSLLRYSHSRLNIKHCPRCKHPVTVNRARDFYRHRAFCNLFSKRDISMGNNKTKISFNALKYKPSKNIIEKLLDLSVQIGTEFTDDFNYACYDSGTCSYRNTTRGKRPSNVCGCPCLCWCSFTIVKIHIEYSTGSHDGSLRVLYHIER